MAKKDNTRSIKSRLKNTTAKLKRREEKIARLEAKIVQMEEDAKKKAVPKATDRVLQRIAKQFQDISSRSSSSNMQLGSDAKKDAALDVLSRLLKN